MIEVRALAKFFGPRPVLKHVNFEVAAGECVALLGPNGAGKTTLLRILATLSKPTAGSVRIAGLPLPQGANAVRQQLGVVSHHTLLYTDLTAEENLRFYARLYGVPQPEDRLTAVLEQVGLIRRRRDMVRTFSRGMQQRLALGRALLNDPKVLLLDEPYTGLDPNATHMLDEMVRALVAQGRTVLLTLHDLAHAVTLADRVLILARGSIAYTAPCRDLTPAAFGQTYEQVVNAARN